LQADKNQSDYQIPKNIKDFEHKKINGENDKKIFRMKLN